MGTLQKQKKLLISHGQIKLHTYIYILNHHNVSPKPSKG